MKKTIFLLLFIMCCSKNYAQYNYHAFRDSINKKIEFLYTYTFSQAPLDWFEPDNLSSTIAKDLTKYLQSEEYKYFDISDFPLIDHIEKEENGLFEVLTIGYHSGGTAGFIPHPIIVKHSDSGATIYNMEDEVGFYEFYHLKDELYLCIGYVPGSGICRNTSAYAIDFGQDTVKFQPVFNSYHSFDLCNSNIIYQEKEKLLIVEIDYLPYMGDSDYEGYLNEKGYNFFSVEDDLEESENIIFKTKFDGGKFVKP